MHGRLRHEGPRRLRSPPAPDSTSRAAAASRAAASSATGPPTVKGSRTKPSKAPSTPKRGPEGTRTPTRSPASASREPESPPVRTQRVRPPRGTENSHSGSSLRTAATSASRFSRAWSRRRATACSQPPVRMSQFTPSCSRTGVPRSAYARAATRERMTSGAARTQPMRMPAQKALLAEPTVRTVEPAGSKAQTGRGISRSSSRPSSAMVSSTTRTVPAERAASTSCRRWSSSASAPVGLWKSATTYARRGAASRSTWRQRPRSQLPRPSDMATGTSRAPAARISWRMLAYEGDSTAMRSPRPAKR